jgi:hypothetical protein
VNFTQALTRELHRWQDETVYLTPDIVAGMVQEAIYKADDFDDLHDMMESAIAKAKEEGDD